MEPIPETAEAIRDFGPLTSSSDTLEELQILAGLVRRIVPECVGMSLALLQHGVTLTLVATEREIAALDGVQYASDGPCVAAAGEDRRVEYRATDPLDEPSWQLFAQATAQQGIASTLTLPILDGETVVGTFNLYASTPDAFTGRQERVAAILNASAADAVTNADLDFRTRRTAEQAPQLLKEESRIQIAVGILVASEGIDPQTARARLRQAAERAGVSENEIARKIIGQLGDHEGPTDAAGRDA